MADYAAIRFPKRHNPLLYRSARLIKNPRNLKCVLWHPTPETGERPERIEEAAEAVRRDQADLRLCRAAEDGESTAGAS